MKTSSPLPDCRVSHSQQPTEWSPKRVTKNHLFWSLWRYPLRFFHYRLSCYSWVRGTCSKTSRKSFYASSKVVGVKTAEMRKIVFVYCLSVHFFPLLFYYILTTVKKYCMRVCLLQLCAVLWLWWPTQLPYSCTGGTGRGTAMVQATDWRGWLTACSL